MAESNFTDDVSIKDTGESQTFLHHVRELTLEEKEKLASDTVLVSDFKQKKFEKEAQKNWDLFYKRNTNKFFKDRHWTTREFSELCDSKEIDGRLILLEVGCGVGNFLFPILEDLPHLFIHACDFSPRAVKFVQDNPLYSADRCQAFQCDLVKNDLTDHIQPSSVDIVTMVFVLSAINPDKMAQALANIHQVLKPDGFVLFRDYGLYDHAQLRFARGHKLEENFYVRQDGTRAFYFSKEKLETLFREGGFSVEKNDYILRQTVNKKEKLCVPRVFLQGKFLKDTMPKNSAIDEKCDSDLVNNSETCSVLESQNRDPKFKTNIDGLLKDKLNVSS